MIGHLVSSVLHSLLLIWISHKESLMRTKFWILSLLAAALLASLYGLGSRAAPSLAATAEPTAAATMGGMPGMNMDSGYSTNDLAPLAKGYYNGKDVYFIHPEASDPDVAGVLTKMMGPKVFAVPSLAKVPEELLGSVYVFANGVTGMGPLGFQLDVFDSVPGDEKYTPLRAINLVTWKENTTAQELKSASDIEKAKTDGKIDIQQPGVVVNMPILVWPEGKR
jgi:hypothetical protein